ncbi:MAG: PadR family transcriptional regulator [Peptococcaceae bacterium]
MSLNKEMLKGSTVILVLSMLRREPMYGYQMIKEITRESEGIFRFKEGTLYPILHSLESKDLIHSYWQGEESSRKRKYYQITAKGEAELKKKHGEWITFRSIVDKIITGEAYA